MYSNAFWFCIQYDLHSLGSKYLLGTIWEVPHICRKSAPVGNLKQTDKQKPIAFSPSKKESFEIVSLHKTC